MIEATAFPISIKRHTGLENISYMALVGMKGDKYEFPKYYSNKEDLIVHTVGEWFGKTLEQLKSPLRIRSIVFPRQICMFLLNRYTNMSLKEIGLKFGGFDHTTVIHSTRLIKNLMENDEEIRNIVQALEIKIQ